MHIFEFQNSGQIRDSFSHNQVHFAQGDWLSLCYFIDSFFSFGLISYMDTCIDINIDNHQLCKVSTRPLPCRYQDWPSRLWTRGKKHPCVKTSEVGLQRDHPFYQFENPAPQTLRILWNNQGAHSPPNSSTFIPLTNWEWLYNLQSLMSIYSRIYTIFRYGIVFW